MPRHSLKPPLVSYYQKPYAREKALHHLRGKLSWCYWRIKRNQPERKPMVDWEHEQDFREGINLTPSTIRRISRRIVRERRDRALEAEIKHEAEIKRAKGSDS